jgi:hypothetical protein
MSRLETGMLKIKRDCDSNEIIYAAIQKNSTYKKTVTL